MVCIKVALNAVKKKFEAEFTITDSETQLGVPGFLVTLTFGTVQASATTDASGICTIGPFKKGTYAYTAVHEDYEDISGTLTA